jgi:hypothetical protein
MKYKTLFIILILLALIPISCKPQSEIRSNTKVSLLPMDSIRRLLDYVNTNVEKLPPDSLLIYTDSIFRASYYIDTLGTHALDIMIKLSEHALSFRDYSGKAAKGLFNLYLIEKNYQKSIDVSEQYLHDSSDLTLILNRSMIYFKIGNKIKADNGFRIVKLHCEKVLEKPENLRKQNYISTIYWLTIITFIEEGKNNAIKLIKKMVNKYPDDPIVKELYEKFQGYKEVDDLLNDVIP